jgi:hypothetical protein
MAKSLVTPNKKIFLQKKYEHLCMLKEFLFKGIEASMWFVFLDEWLERLFQSINEPILPILKSL